MAITAAIGAAKVGVDIGEAIANGKLNYEKSKYLEKIEEMEGYRTQLNSRLENLRALKARIPSFWNDENSEKMMMAIDKTIEKVVLISERVEKVIQACKNSVEILDKNKLTAGEKLGDVLDMLNGISDL